MTKKPVKYHEGGFTPKWLDWTGRYFDNIGLSEGHDCR